MLKFFRQRKSNRGTRRAPLRGVCETCACVALLAAPGAAGAQSTSREAAREERASQIREQQMRRDSDLRMRALDNLGRRNAIRRAAPVFGAPRPRLTREQKRMLEPAPDLRAAHADSLALSETGMIRLLPFAECDSGRTVSAAAECLDKPPIAGSGSFYSFRRRTHEAGGWSDIHLRDGVLYTGFANAVIGMIAELGDVPVASVNPSDPPVSEIAAFAPASEVSRAREQYARIKTGFPVGASRVAAALPARQNTTYVLRSIAYRRGDIFDSEMKRTDVTILLRIVSAEPDGALTILWRELRRQKSPKLKFEKPARKDSRASN